MTAAKLRELEAKAKGNSVESYKNQFMLLDYLRKHTQDFIKLIEAAEQLVNGGHPDEAIHHMTEALAAFKE